MSNIEKTEEEKMQTRRKLLTSAGRVAVTAPAVALLLSASSMPAAALGHSQYDSSGDATDPGTSGEDGSAYGGVGYGGDDNVDFDGTVDVA